MEAIDIINKQILVITYLTEKEDSAGLSEILEQVATQLEIARDDLLTEVKNETQG